MINNNTHWTGSRHINRGCSGYNTRNWENYPPRQPNISLIDPQFDGYIGIYPRKIGTINLFENIDISFTIRVYCIN